MNWLAQMEARRLVLSLREMLVRFDENLAAHVLMQHCVPYILEEDPEIDRARTEQMLKVAHLLGDSADYAAYYETNQHEKPFEEQYQMKPGEAHEYLHRVAFLREWLAEQPRWGEPITLLDVACNDGWMAENLADLKMDTINAPKVIYHGIDLNPGCIKRAKQRKVQGAKFVHGHAEHALSRAPLAKGPKAKRYDAVVAFELVEHVKDPDQLLATMAACCKPGGSLFVSTPLGACTGGALDRWWVVEPAGHVRAYTPRTFAELLSRHGRCESITINKATVGELMVARCEVPDGA